MNNVLGIIPARYGSGRFPGKPLVMIKGKSMIQRVYEQAKKAEKLHDVIVATEDNRIADHVKSFGGKVELTSDKHKSGTDRCAEIAEKRKDYDIIINIQGDEPFIDPLQIDKLSDCLSNPNTEIASMFCKITIRDDITNPHKVKVTMNKSMQALYFSRSAIPFSDYTDLEDAIKKGIYFKHLGLYGYKRETLLKISHLEISPLEKIENLEQLRWLENGYGIQLTETQGENICIDTPEDLNNIP